MQIMSQENKKVYVEVHEREFQVFFRPIPINQAINRYMKVEVSCMHERGEM